MVTIKRFMKGPADRDGWNFRIGRKKVVLWKIKETNFGKKEDCERCCPAGRGQKKRAT